MNAYTRINLILCGMILAVLLQAGTASAQIAPRRPANLGHRGSGYYGGYDPVIYPDINKSNAAYQQAALQAKQYQAQSSMAATSAWQNINQSMAQQANMQTQSMMAQRDSAKDWWFQQQSQQMANRQARESYQPMVLPNSAEAYDPGLQAATQTPAAREIMLWPTLLKNPAFDQLRAKVESPFRRAYADDKPLTADDYRGILQAIDEMKATMKEMSSRVIESEYEAVEGYLNELAADAQKRLNARTSPKTEMDKEKTSNEKP
jgi:hypothetical protein